MADFLWHKVSEKEKEEIKQEAKRIMNRFSERLGSVRMDIKTDLGKDDFERSECREEIPEIDRDIMFENAPKKNKDFIIAEKGDW